MFSTGDSVVLVQPRYGRGGEACVTNQIVGKVGRKYAYLLDSREDGHWDTRGVPFNLETGIEHRRDKYQNYLMRIYRPEDWAAKCRRSGVLDALRQHGIRFAEYGDPKWSTKTLEGLLAVLRDPDPGLTTTTEERSAQCQKRV